MSDEGLQLLREIRDQQRESIALQREHIARYEQQLKRAEEIQTRAEAMQQRGQRVLRYLGWVLVPLLSLVVLGLVWSVFRRFLS